MRHVDLVIEHGLVLTMDPQRRMLRDGAVVVDGGRIVEVVTTADAAIRYTAGRRLDAGGGVVLPGLVDAHIHNTQQLSRGLADDVDLLTWVYERILPYEAQLTAEDAYVSALLTCAELIRTGTTCASDPGGYQVHDVGRAYEETGLRGILAWAGMDRWSDDRQIPDELPGKRDTAGTLAAMDDVVSTWHGAAGGRIRAAYGLRTEPNVSPELFRATKQRADRAGTLIHMHTAVNERQVEWMRQRTGHTSVDYLESLGVLDENWLLAHLVAVSEAEVELLAERDVRVAHQPGASVHGTYGAVSRGRIPEMLAAGITVGMGCDANSANNSLDMFRALHQVATLHDEARMQPGLLSPERALEMATIDGARAVRWEDEIGSLETGKRADVIILDTRATNLVPLHEPAVVAGLVYSGEGANVRTTIVDGVVLMEDRRLLTIDLNWLLDEAQRRAERLLRELPYELVARWPLQEAQRQPG